MRSYSPFARARSAGVQNLFLRKGEGIGWQGAMAGRLVRLTIVGRVATWVVVNDEAGRWPFASSSCSGEVHLIMLEQLDEANFNECLVAAEVRGSSVSPKALTSPHG